MLRFWGCMAGLRATQDLSCSLPRTLFAVVRVPWRRLFLPHPLMVAALCETTHVSVKEVAGERAHQFVREIYRGGHSPDKPRPGGFLVLDDHHCAFF